MNQYPPAPKQTKEMLTEAFAQFAKEVFQCDLNTLVKAYMSYGPDSFRIAKELDSYGWDLTIDDVNELEELHWIAERALTNARQKWVDDNKIEPPFEVGTELIHGVITGICEHSPARYLVKRPTDGDTSRLLVKFEDAKLKHE
jgi:hypothetical protein